MTNDETSLQDQIDDATFDFTMGNSAAAITKLATLGKNYPDSFETWHALTEIYFSEGRYDDSLAAADKDKAEHYGAQARMLGWKDELKSPPEKDTL